MIKMTVRDISTRRYNLARFHGWTKIFSQAYMTRVIVLKFCFHCLMNTMQNNATVHRIHVCVCTCIKTKVGYDS